MYVRLCPAVAAVNFILFACKFTLYAHESSDFGLTRGRKKHFIFFFLFPNRALAKNPQKFVPSVDESQTYHLLLLIYRCEIGALANTALNYEAFSSLFEIIIAAGVTGVFLLSSARCTCSVWSS